MLKYNIKKPIMLWCLASLFFAFQFVLRLSPGILREEIIQKFSIDAASFGTLAGYYYLGYSGAQIPLGIMLDHLSFRFVASISIFTAVIGTIIFGTTDSFNLLLFSRFLIGVGSGVAFLSVVKITKTFFDPKYHSILIGFAFTFGLTGGVFGATPANILFNQFGYYNVFLVLAIIGFVISASILFLGKIDQEVHNESFNEIISSVLRLLFNPTILLISISGGLMVGSLEGFADVWAIPFFSQNFNMSKMESTTVISFVYFGMCIGGPLLAGFANILKSNNFMILLTGLFTIVIFIILFYIPTISFITCTILMFSLGILCCYQVLVFTVVSEQVDKSSASLAIAITNCINMSFGHFFHSIIGNTFEQNWDGKLNELGNALYSKEVFISSLIIIPICCFIGQLGFGFLSLKSKFRKS